MKHYTAGENLLKAEREGFITIESNARGLGYIMDPNDRSRLAIVTSRGGIALTKQQLEALLAEAGGIMEVFA